MPNHNYFLGMLGQIASASKDASTKVGCLIVGPDNEIRSTGYNSFPRGINDNDPSRQERPKKYMFIEHAERNAIYNAARVGTPMKGCRIYMDFLPCADCARAIIQAGITEILVSAVDFDDKMAYWNQRWKESIEASMEMLNEADIRIRVVLLDGSFRTDHNFPKMRRTYDV